MDDEDLLERVWEHRETVLYPKLFGESPTTTIAVLTPEVFTEVFRQEEIDPLWLHHGVVWQRSGDVWTAVTSGMSNPWWDEQAEPEEPSGLGIELAMRCRSDDAWAPLMLSRLMAYQLLIAAGRFPDTPWLADYARIPIGATATPTSQLTHLMLVPRPALTGLQLESGTFDILEVVPITTAELGVARKSGGAELQGMLAEANADNAFDLERASVV